MEQYDLIPEDMREVRQWGCYRLEQGRDKPTKVPISAITGRPANTTDSSTWADFDTALEAVEKYNCHGLGFFLAPPYVGVDLDDVKDEIDRYLNDDHDDNIVSEFIETLCSYTERSVSGNGIHIIIRGDLPDGGRRKGNVEMYKDGRFFVMTGDVLGRFSRVEDDDYGKLGYLHSKYIGQRQIVTPESVEGSGVDLNEDELIEIAMKSKTGTRFGLFLNGGWDQFYDSQSEADMAFANDLAFWTNRDYRMMDSIFRRSSLYREKWDSGRGESTYGQDTLNKAIAECSNVFRPRERDEDFNLYVLEDSTEKVHQKFYSYDDTGNAQRFVDYGGKAIRYSYVRKNWYYYNGKTWTIDQEGTIKRLADKVIDRMKQEKLYVPDGEDPEEAQKLFRRHIKATRQSRGKTSMIKEAEHLLPVSLEAFDADPFLLNVQNGYLELNTGQMHEHDREKYFTKISNVEYAAGTMCPRWLTFLDEIFGGDKELINYIQRAVGYSLSGSTEEQVMFFLHGKGRNGKSVFLDIVTDLFGNYAVNIKPESIMVNNNQGGANSDIARLDGARFVTTTEPNEGVRLDEGLVKQITGGDKVTARFLYENEFEYKPQFKLWMATNHKPIIRGTDDGIWRRIALIPFDVQIPIEKVDKNLTNKLRQEIKGILNWAVEGYRQWRESGLGEPKAMQKELREYRLEMDVLEAFIEECCTTADSAEVQAKDLYQEYRNWAKQNEQYLMSSTKFGREMAKKYTKRKSNGVMVYEGIRIPQNAPYSINY